MYSCMPAVRQQCPVSSVLLPVLVQTPPPCQRRNRRSRGRPAWLQVGEEGGDGGGPREHSPGSVVFEAPGAREGRRGRGRQHRGQHRDTVVLDLAGLARAPGVNEVVDTLHGALQLLDGFGRVVVVIAAVGAGVQRLVITIIETRRFP